MLVIKALKGLVYTKDSKTYQTVTDLHYPKTFFVFSGVYVPQKVIKVSVGGKKASKDGEAASDGSK